MAMTLPAIAADTVGLVDESKGHWSLRADNGNSTFGYGVPGDVPFSGDWNCDGVDTIRNSNIQGVADAQAFAGSYTGVLAFDP